MKSPIMSFQCLTLQLPQPSSLVRSIQYVVYCLHVMALLGYTSNKL
jgi:hypothetical protein